MKRHIGAIDSVGEGSMYASHEPVTGTETEITAAAILRSVTGIPEFTCTEMDRLAEITAEEAIVFASAVEAAQTA